METPNTISGFYFGKAKIIAIIVVILVVMFIAIYFRENIKNLIGLQSEKRDVLETGTWEKEMAGKYYGALHSGIFGESEDEPAILRLASESKGRKGFNKIARQYFDMYKKDLEKEIIRLLDNENQRNTFYSNIAG